MKENQEREKRDMGRNSPSIVSGSRHWPQTHPTPEAVATGCLGEDVRGQVRHTMDFKDRAYYLLDL